jgi:ribokinase
MATGSTSSLFRGSTDSEVSMGDAQGQGVTVVGSYNVGLFCRGGRLPAVGETVIGELFWEGPGGKGSNQAVAAAIFGAPTRFIARIGDDRHGTSALTMYRGFGMETSLIQVDESAPTGVSVILIDQDGLNQIMVVPGANYRLSPEDIDAAEGALAESAIVGFQLENRLEVTAYGIRKAHRMGVKTLLDPAPAAPLPTDLYPCLDYIKPNESEATTLTGIAMHDVATAAEAGRWLVERGVGTAVVTLGAGGAVLVNRDTVRHFPAPAVEARDSTGAGDTFCGALMTALARGESAGNAIVFANQAAALSVTRLGVIEAIPSSADVAAALGRGATAS